MARVSACQKYPSKLTLGAFRASRLHGRNGTTNFSIGWNAARNHWSTLRIATTWNEGEPDRSRWSCGSPCVPLGTDVRRVHRHYYAPMLTGYGLRVLESAGYPWRTAMGIRAGASFSSLCATAGRCGLTASSCMTSPVTVVALDHHGDPNRRLHRVYPEASSLNSLGAMFGLVLRHEAACAKHPRLPRSRRSAIEPLATSFQSGIPPASVGFRSSRPAQRTTFGWWIVATMPRKSALNSLASLWPVVLGAVGMGYLLAYA